MSNEVLNNIISFVLIPILPVITAYIVALLRKKISEIDSKIKDDTLKKYLNIAETLIENSVIVVSQTFVDELKKKNIFDKAAQSEAFEMAKQKILSALSESVKLALSEVYGDLEKYVDSRIEYYVRRNKTT